MVVAVTVTPWQSSLSANVIPCLGLLHQPTHLPSRICIAHRPSSAGTRWCPFFLFSHALSNYPLHAPKGYFFFFWFGCRSIKSKKELPSLGPPPSPLDQPSQLPQPEPIQTRQRLGKAKRAAVPLSLFCFVLCFFLFP